jgi:hypothetical protein
MPIHQRWRIFLRLAPRHNPNNILRDRPNRNAATRRTKFIEERNLIEPFGLIHHMASGSLVSAEKSW